MTADVFPRRSELPEPAWRSFDRPTSSFPQDSNPSHISKTMFGYKKYPTPILRPLWPFFAGGTIFPYNSNSALM
ncbi:hypothetical protein G7K_4456-t1 [Saitoella complicata NRRL Y-17804]|uniref:Uncharacterized protein n=1 Tax=Saitoella complicata (strain BCRC 22490 / CBS 7301 / JCM 7358 / NBRC 10748 / NRRL Y-17804) TaxID=698492 RepID=A0A0E9NKC1_SAICN|nr:hypothetical protein G7K_4456-t1 [Saitoella complicata NRRL Y-17804]